MSARTTELDKFFPLPSAAGPSPSAPARLPGITRAASDALVKALKDNHVNHHAYFNDRGFHNHCSHHLVAIYGLGASGPLIEAAYGTHTDYQRPAFDSPEAITDGNLWKHLGERDFYNSYLEYFRGALLKKDMAEVVEEFVFSPKANIGTPGVEGHPRMLNRFLAAIFHPMIHVGCGLEFGLPGLVAEGLAQAATHPAQGEDILLPSSLFESSATHAKGASGVSRLTQMLPNLKLGRSASSGGVDGATQGKATGTHAFDILARVLADEKFSAGNLGLPKPEFQFLFEHVYKTVGESLTELSGEWVAELDGEGATPEAITRKIEEVVWMNAVIYGVAGWAGRERGPYKSFNADFFYMHLVTSSLFLSSIVAHLSPHSATLLLRAHFAVSLAWYLIQGRPALPLREFYAGTTAMPSPPETVARPTPAEGTLTPDVAAPNPWLPIIQTTLVHPGEHLCKTQRALMHAATLYGSRVPADFAGIQLDGVVDVLDGTLFVRVAGLTADRLRWMKEGQSKVTVDVGYEWDRMGYF